jgi:hypothetical protein
VAISFGNVTCGCGHEALLHDAFGCAAFLGAYAATAGEQRYCACRAVREEAKALPELPSDARGNIVATVRVRERSGSAIAVCDVPAVLELGASAEQVVAQLKTRLRDAVGPSRTQTRQLVLVVRENFDARVETLR